MPIDATQPTTLDATYDKWAVQQFRTDGDALAGYGMAAIEPVRVFVRLVKYRIRDDGVPERSPLPGDVRAFEIGDLYAAIPDFPAFGVALQSLTEAIASYAAGQGIL